MLKLSLCIGVLLATATAISVESSKLSKEVMSPEPKPTWYKCYARGDPHYLSLSKLKFNDYHDGTFTMFKRGDDLVQVKQASQTGWWNGRQVVKKLTVTAGSDAVSVSIEDGCKPTFTGNYSTSLKYGILRLKTGGNVAWRIRFRRHRRRIPKRVCFMNVWIETQTNTGVEGFCALNSKEEVEKHHDQIDLDNTAAEALFADHPEWLTEAQDQGCDKDSDTYADCLEDFFEDKKVKDTVVCERETGTLTCEGGKVLDIVSASYGRQDSETCPIHIHDISNTDCHAENSLEKVQAACQGKTSCILEANNNVFGDPCYHIYKYLSTSHRCVSPK